MDETGETDRSKTAASFACGGWTPVWMALSQRRAPAPTVAMENGAEARECGQFAEARVGGGLGGSHCALRAVEEALDKPEHVGRAENDDERGGDSPTAADTEEGAGENEELAYKAAEHGQASLAMIGLPMLSGFVGEFLILSSTFLGVSRGWAIAASLVVILGAAYMLWLVQRLFYGPESAMTASKSPTDARFGELATLAPLAVLMLVMGVAPSLWLSAIQTGVHPPQAKEAAVLLRSVSPVSSISIPGEVQR